MDQVALSALLLCARSINLRFDETTKLGHGLQDFVSTWKDLWTELQLWYQDRPQALRPIFEVSSQDTEKDDSWRAGSFPVILFTSSSSLCTNQLHHTSALLLLECKPRTTKPRVERGSSLSPLWHAQRICGIAAANEDSWDPALIASLLHAAQRMTHESQQRVILDTLDRVRKSGGWNLQEEAEKLKAMWDMAEGS
jgi:hypothetical protein